VVRLVVLCLVAGCVIADDCDTDCGSWIDLGPESDCGNNTAGEAVHKWWRFIDYCDEACEEFRCCDGPCSEQTGPDNMELTEVPAEAPVTQAPATEAPADSDSEIDELVDPKTCVSDCSTKFDFVKTYNWYTKTDELCENEITKAVTGRGGEGCRADPWFTIEECDPETCQKFVWRGTYPLQCDVEDRYLWCCEPILSTPDATIGAHCDARLECHAIIDPMDIENGRANERYTTTWFDAQGNDLNYISDRFAQYTELVDEDKVVIVLLVRAGSLAPGEHVMTCQISDASRDGTTVISSEAVLSVFSVTAEGAVEYFDNAPADLLCTAQGADFDDFGYEVFWYTEVDGVEVLVEGEGYTTSLFAVEGGLGSKLTVAEEYQTIGDTVFTCKVQYTAEHSCRSDVCTEEATATLSIITVATSPQEYCAHVGAEGEVSFVVVGSDVSWPRESVVFTGADGITYTSDPSEDHRITWVPNDDGDMVATLILAPSLQDSVETRVYTGSAVYREFRVDVPIFLHVMDLRPADEGVAPVQVDRDQGTLLTVVLSGGTLGNPVWSDQEGNFFTAEDAPEGYDVSVSPDKTETYLQISPDQLTKLGTKVYVVIVDLYKPDAAPTDEPCMKGQAEVSLDTFQCHMVYEARSCDPDRQTCSTTQVILPGLCVCDAEYDGTCDDDGVMRARDETTQTPVSCPPTLSFELSDWGPEVCEEERCYDYPSPSTKTRDCMCGGEVDNTKCGGEVLQTSYICPGTKAWSLTPWSDLLCPADPCYPAQSKITRECTCDGFSDSDKCDGELETLVDCPVESFSWSEWGVKDCSDTGCYSKLNTRSRSCTCNSNIDAEQCEGENEEEYVCEADKAWLRSPVAPSVCETVDLCYDVTLPQAMQCLCEGELDDSKCDGTEEEEVLCPASKSFELSEWDAVNECSPCFPEIPQTKRRHCSCGDINDESGEQCQAPLTVTEKCPATGDWVFSEWTAEPCQENCNEVVQTPRSRQCECEGNIDNTRCDGPLDDLIDCELKPYEWSEWSERRCPNVCYSATTKRYRLCSCLDDIDFSKCSGLSLEFRPCEVPDSCFT